MKTLVAALFLTSALAHAQQSIEIALAPGLRPAHPGGRVLVVLAAADSKNPLRAIGDTGMDAAPLFGTDAPDWKAGAPSDITARIDAGSAAFPLASFAQVKPGEYNVQALLRCHPDLLVDDAPGNLYSAPQRVRIDPSQPGTLRLELSKSFDGPELPADTAEVRFVRLRSEKLSRFHGREMFLRAAVLLPAGFDEQPERRYPLMVEIGGYGQRCASLARMYAKGSRMLGNWNAESLPRFLLVMPDGAGPLGDPYQVDSENHGPYGAALTEELIPHIESRFRGLGEARARFTTGHSTGGWVSLALQVHYPEFFNGCWSFAPDGVDFRHFQLIDVYKDKNAYVNRHGFERASKRTIDGDIEFSVRHECQLENVLGMGDSWTRSGGQWGAWNATYGPRGKDGAPSSLWDPRTGELEDGLRNAWKRHDLRLKLEENWKTLAPKLSGKLHVFVGDADDYFLNNAVVRLENFLKRAEPAHGGEIRFGWRAGHGYHPLSVEEVLKAALARMESAPR